MVSGNWYWTSRKSSIHLSLPVIPKCRQGALVTIPCLCTFPQTLVEYGANVTMQNHAGEKPSQSAEHHGHTLCSRYLVVVETCMSLASQVVKLTKQLKE
ncbi:hypothetical protein GH733_009519 [Mirounga leonina]|nr:hypothetical protein GH733_009519 [Mirounga leonina]